MGNTPTKEPKLGHWSILNEPPPGYASGSPIASPEPSPPEDECSSVSKPAKQHSTPTPRATAFAPSPAKAPRTPLYGSDYPSTPTTSSRSFASNTPPPPTATEALPPYSPPLASSPRPTSSPHARTPPPVSPHDPRLTPRHRNHPHSTHRQHTRALPAELLEIIASSLLDLDERPALATLARLNSSAYAIVIPYLYHTVELRRQSLHLLLHGIPLPSRFLPALQEKELELEKRTGAERSEEKERRKRWCYGFVREVRADGLLPDLKLCEAILSLLNDDSTPRTPLDDRAGAPETTRGDARTSLPLFPNVRTLTLTAEHLLFNLQYQHAYEPVRPSPAFFSSFPTSKPVHPSLPPFLAALLALCAPHEIHILGSVSVLAATRPTGDVPMGLDAIPRLTKELVERVCLQAAAAGRLQELVWHGITEEQIPHLGEGARVDLHFARPHPKRTLTTTSRANQLRAGIRREIPESLGLWRICGPGLVGPGKEEHGEVLEQTISGSAGAGEGALAEVVCERVQWLNADEVARVGCGCGCFGGEAKDGRRARLRLLVAQEERETPWRYSTDGVTRTRWRRKSRVVDGAAPWWSA